MWKIISFCIAGCIPLAAQLAFAAQIPLYPGPTLKGERVERTDSGEGYSETIVWDVYYSKDSKARVTAFYKSKGYKTTKDEPSESLFARSGAALSGDWAIVVRIPENDISAEDLFGPLEDELMQEGGMQSAGLMAKAHTRKDLDAVKAKYGFLANEAFIPDKSVADRLSACEERVNAGMDQFNDESESIDEKMQQMVMQGRYDEMQKLVNQRMAQGSAGATASHWDEWLDCFDALARDVYRAEIRIRVK